MAEEQGSAARTGRAALRLKVDQDHDQVDEASGEKLWRAWFDGDPPAEFRACRTEIQLAPFFGRNPYEAVGSFLFHFGRCAGVEIDIPESYFDPESRGDSEDQADMRGQPR